MIGAVFDWDGTLVDIDEREFYCINRSLEAHNISPVSREFFITNYYRRPFEVGTGPRMVLDAAADGRGEVTEKLYETYRGLFAGTVEKAKLHDGALSLLRALREMQYQVGIATMRFTRSVVEREMEVLGVGSYAYSLLTREDLGVKRPLGSLEETVQQRTRLVSMVLEELVLKARDSFLAGDSWWDVRAGKRVGTKTVLVLTGFSFHNDFSSERPDLIVRSLRELEVEIRKNRLTTQTE